MKPPFSFLPALPVATGMVAGILIYEYTYPMFCVISGVSCILIFIFLYFKKFHYLSFYILSTVAGLCCSYANADFHQHINFSVPGNHLVEAKVIEDNSGSESPSLIIEFLSVDSVPTLPLRCIVASSARMFNQDIALRSTLKFQCHLNNLSSRIDVPYEYDSTESLFNEGISLIAYPVSGEILVSPPTRPYQIINEFRNLIFRSIVNSPVDGDTAAFLVAVILGERHFLDHRSVENYRTLGVAHVLALSGLHVGVLASLFAFLIWPVRLFPHYRALRFILLLSAIWTYTAVCGMGDSILRAAIMLSIASIAGLLQRSYYPANALLVAIAVILAISPSSLFSPGFQLSVSAVLAIIIFSPIVPKKLKRHPVRFFLANMVVFPLAAMLGTGLISAYHFATFPSAFLLSNIIVGLIFPYILIGGVVISIFTAVGMEFSLLGRVIDLSFSYMNGVIEILIRVMPQPVGNLHFSAWAFVPYAISFGLFGLAVLRKRIAPALAGAAFFIFTLEIVDFSKPTLPKSELFIVRRPSTCILLRSGNTAALIPVCPDHDTLVARQIIESRCHNYLFSAGCKGLLNLKKSSITLSGFSLQGDNIYAGNNHLLLLNDDMLRFQPGSHLDYLLVGGNFTGDLSSALDITRPDSIILSADIHPSRRKRFLREIIDHDKIIDLRHRPFALVSRK